MKNEPSNYREVTRSDWIRTGIYVLIMTAVLIAGALLLIQWSWPAGIILWLLLCVGGSMSIIVRWHAGVTAYRCTQCGHEFEITTMTNFLSPHLPERKYLKCPACGKRDWMTVLMKQ